MLNTEVITKNIESLRHDATRMAKDIGRLQDDLLNSTKKNGLKFANELTQHVQDGLEIAQETFGSINDNLGDVSDQVSKKVNRLNKTARGQIRTLDKRVYTRPFGYYFIGGALAVGFATGIILALGAKKA